MDYQIVSITEEPQTRDGEYSPDIRVQFMVGKDGPFFERFRKSEYSATAAAQRLGDFARDVKQLRGTP